MIGWNESYNWTYEEFKKVVITALEIEEKKSVNLDCEHASYENMKQIVAWAEERGYRTEISDNRESVKIQK